VARNRVVLVDSLPTRADVKALEQVADVYLDTAPFSGSISVIDPLEIGLPPVIQQGTTHRSRMAAALVRELNIPELITDSEAGYRELAVKLGTEPAFRAELRARILAAMAQRPKFVNAPAYAADLGRLLETLVQRRQKSRSELSAA
jgi:predicted O-linked N-acetylglucosamine transferase (SPINDLY family)